MPLEVLLLNGERKIVLAGSATVASIIPLEAKRSTLAAPLPCSRGAITIQDGACCAMYVVATSTRIRAHSRSRITG